MIRQALTEAESAYDREMIDQTEGIRREAAIAINIIPGSREALEAEHGEVYDTSELQQAFRVEGFLAPMIVCTRKSDGVRGSMFFQANPRFYFGFQPE